MLKKSGQIWFTIALLITFNFMLSSISFAAVALDDTLNDRNSNSSVIYHKSIILNKGVLLDRALNGVTDLKNEKFCSKALLISNDTGEKSVLDYLLD